MRYHATPAVLMSLVVTACSGDALTSLRPTTVDATSTVAAHSSQDSGIPSRSHSMVGHCELRTLATIPSPAPPVFQQTAVGTCQLSHVGQAAVHFIQVVNFGTSTQQSRELTYTTADGDVLRAMSAGTSTRTATGVAFSSTIIFLGGTGRFAGATGQAHAQGTANLVAGTSEYSLQGWILLDRDKHADEHADEHAENGDA